MSKPTQTLYRMTADHTGEHLHVLLQDGHSSLPSVLGPMTPIEVDADHFLWMTENERWLHQCNLMDRGWTVLGSQHALVRGKGPSGPDLVLQSIATTRSTEKANAG